MRLVPLLFSLPSELVRMMWSELNGSTINGFRLMASTLLNEMGGGAGLQMPLIQHQLIRCQEIEEFIIKNNI